MMKKTVLAGVLVLIALPAFAENIAGTYKTTEGMMTLRQNGDRVNGKYTNDNGEITGTLYDSNLDGFWIEDHSDRRCSSSKNGRYYWGRISFEFKDDGFSGTWGYCNDAPSRAWSGTRSGGSSFAADKFSSDDAAESVQGSWGSSEGDIAFTQNGVKVRGKYNPQDNGEITGTLKGSYLDAYWIENHSAQKCSTAKNGRYFWGKLQVTFDGDSFSGKWGYCDEKPSKPWTGQRK
jgi:hypothetical protein